MQQLITQYQASSEDGAVALCFGVESSSKEAVILSLEVTDEKGKLRATLRVDLVAQALSVQTATLSSASALSICLLSCGLSAVTPHVINCLTTAKAPKAKSFVACMRRKGVSILAAVAACAVKCVVGSAAPSIQP